MKRIIITIITIAFFEYCWSQSSTDVCQLLRRYEQQYTIQSAEYADALMWAAMVCADEGDCRQAKRLMKQSRSLFKEYGHGPFEGRDTISEIFYDDLRAKLEYLSGRNYMALLYKKKSLKMKHLHFGSQSETCLNASLELSQLYAERLKYQKSNRYHNQAYDAYVERIKQEFCQSSESERALYWETAIKYIDKTLDLAHRSSRHSHLGGDHSLASAAYNAMLLSKGLLLNTSIGFEEYITNSGNKEAISLLQEKKVFADMQVQQSVLDSIDYEILHALQRKGQRFQLPHLSIGWKDVAKKLSKNDLAIEFYKTKNGFYGAILIKRDWTSPKVVKLENLISYRKTYLSLDKALNDFSLEHYSIDKNDDLLKLSKAVWTDDIVKHFPQSGDGNIYFSADGELLITGIEYLPFVKASGDGSFYSLSDLFPVYRLSSTRELVVAKSNTKNVEAAIYGGLRYDMEYDDLLADARLNKSSKNADLAYLHNEKQRALREADAIDYLEGTQKEADSIVFAINKSANPKLHATSFTGIAGTEASFKNLSHQYYRLIHIATHGYFYGENDSTFNKFKLGHHPMVRSGLLLAGADYKWFGETLPNEVDDGFLTALEISNLDFRGLDLVVLSACETGKGNVKGDGVFGLQRGFKMASANSILMSLWKVDDEATCLLMTEFYRYWIGENKTKHESLELARQTIRSHKEKGWDNPKYWAAFILLDGLD